MQVLRAYIATDGTLKVFIIHKVGHLLAGMVVALIAYYVFNNFIDAFFWALFIGIAREWMKTTPLYMHITTAILTASGSFLVIPLLTLSPAYQVLLCGMASLYVMGVLYSIYFKNK